MIVRTVSVLALLAFSSVSAAVEFRMVKDAETALAPLDSFPHDFYAVGDSLYFTATRPETGTELFVIEGQSAVPRLVADLAPNGASSWPRVLGDARGRLVVSADVGNLGSGFFGRNDRIIALDPATGEYSELHAFGGWMPLWEGEQRFERASQFPGVVAFLDRFGNDLWATDTTAGATQPIFASPQGVVPELCAMGDRFLFAYRRDGQAELWLSNGLTLGTGVLGTLPGATALDIATRGDGCYVLARDADGLAVWLSNGTLPGTGIVAELPGDNGRIFPLGDAVLVLGRSGETYTLSRLGLKTPLWSGPLDGLDSASSIVGDRLAIANSANGSPRLLISDGTPDGTRLAQYQGSPDLPWRSAMLAPGSDYLIVSDAFDTYRVALADATVTRLDGSPLQFHGDTARVGDAVIGSGHTDVEGTEVWRSDGTPGGTYPLADVAQSTRSGAAGVVAAATSRSGVVLYASLQDAHGASGLIHSLWRSDGSGAGTFALPRERYAVDDDVEYLHALGDSVVFAANSDTTASPGSGRLYRTDPSFDEVALLWQQSGPIRELKASDGAVFFDCVQPGGRVLCGYRAGAANVQPLLAAGQSYRLLGSTGDAMLAWTSAGFMRSDGTPSGTTFFATGLRDGSYNPLPTASAGGRVFFYACSSPSPYDCGLASSDGTSAGTRMVRAHYWPISHITPFRNGVAFVTDDPHRELWISDGTTAGTRPVVPLEGRVGSLASVNGRLHATTQSVEVFRNLYHVSDGTPAGTRTVALPPGVNITLDDAFAPLDDDTVVFGCNADWFGTELCVTDAAAAAISVLGDFFQGPASSFGSFVAKGGGSSYFAINDGRHGAELWRLTGDLIFRARFEPVL